MSRFDHMEFSDGSIVVNAKKYDGGQALKVALDEYGLPTTARNLGQTWCRYYPKTPEELQCELGNDGCYKLCPEGRGSFPVWVIRR